MLIKDILLVVLHKNFTVYCAGLSMYLCICAGMDSSCSALLI